MTTTSDPSRGPLARRSPVRSVHHGIEIVDDYAWLRAGNWRQVLDDPSKLDPEIRAHLEAENIHCADAMAHTLPLQQRLFEEMRGRIREDDSTVPEPDGLWAYSTAYATGAQYPRICRQPRDGGTARVLIDGDQMGAGLAYFSLLGAVHSPDHLSMVYATDETGSEAYRLRIRDLDTLRDLPDELPDSNGRAVWAADSRTLFYVRRDADRRPAAVMRHRLGTPVEADVEVYREPEPGFFVDVSQTRSRSLIVISTHTHETSEVYVVPSDAPESTPRLVARRQTGHEYDVDHGSGGRLVIRTNRDGAEDFKLMEAPLADPGPGSWREIEPHRPGRLILHHVTLARHLIRLERENGLPRIIVRRLSDGAEHEIAFAEEAYELGLVEGYECDTDEVRYTYASMTTPQETWEYGLETRQRTLLKRQEVPSGHDPADYVTRRIQAPAPDGETVPVTLLYRKETALDGAAPALLSGYGSYGMSMPASFAVTPLSLVDRGFVYAIAHVRGGKEKGYRWYRDGKLARKTNTFTDFIAVADHLVATGVAARGRIVAHGGSAGGMLMGAAANMAPDRFLGIIALVPFVDVLATMLDDGLPLTPLEWPEWGNPIASREDFLRIRGYCPYSNVRAQAYPAILAKAGLSDPRVTYWEAAKWVARLRATKTDGNALLLKVNMDAGHGGASGRFERLREAALAFAFTLDLAGKGEVEPARAR